MRKIKGKKIVNMYNLPGIQFIPREQPHKNKEVMLLKNIHFTMHLPQGKSKQNKKAKELQKGTAYFLKKY